MPWFSVYISSDNFANGGYHQLCRGFQKAFIMAGGPSEMALFAQKVSCEGERVAFFSPGSLPYITTRSEIWVLAPVINRNPRKSLL